MGGHGTELRAPDVTTLLHAWSAGDTGGARPACSAGLPGPPRARGGYLRRERREHTLQPTALVHEAYLRLIDISVATAERDWQAARAWLYAALKGERPR